MPLETKEDKLKREEKDESTSRNNYYSYYCNYNDTNI